MRILLLMAVAMLAAAGTPVQAIINGRLGQLLNNPLLAALVSFIGGTLTLSVLVLVTTPGLPALPPGGSLRWYLFTGGLFGAIFVTTVLILVPRIGTANLIAATITGQLVASLIIDHFGWLNVPQNSISTTKIAGCLLLLVGVLLIQRG